MELSSEQMQAVGALLEWDKAEPIRPALLALIRHSRGMSPSEIAERVGYPVGQIEKWVERFERQGLLALIPPHVRDAAADMLAARGIDLGSRRPADGPDRGLPPAERAQHGVSGRSDDGWDRPDACPIPGCSARTPEGLLVLLGAEGGEEAERPIDWDALARWLAEHGCTPDGVDRWLSRARDVVEARRRIGSADA